MRFEPYAGRRAGGFLGKDGAELLAAALLGSGLT